MKINWRSIFAIILLSTLTFLLVTTPVQLPGMVGETDFRPYWSSSYLFIRGSDFGNPEQLDHIERTLTGWDEPYTMHAWFAPVGNLILAPYTFLPFSQAVIFWLITSAVAIVTSSLLIWPYKKTHLWTPIVVTLSYSMTLVSLAAGQINTFEVFGLALFLALKNANYNFRAGLFLILTTIKAHLVIITLPLLLLDLIRKKQMRTLAGFFISLLGSAIVLFAINPGWPASFLKLLTFGMEVTRETPTLNGLLVIMGEYIWGKWLWVLFLGIAAAIWLKMGKKVDYRTLIDITILLGLTVSPVGWSYDQIMLLFPLLRIFEWIQEHVLKKNEAYFIILLLFIANGFSYYQRSLEISDVWFFWLPLLVAMLYFYGLKRMNSSKDTSLFYAYKEKAP